MGKEVAWVTFYENKVVSYDFLVWQANKVVNTNPIIIAIVEKDSEWFRHVFPLPPFCVCILGFRRGCRPLLFLKGTHLLKK